MTLTMEGGDAIAQSLAVYHPGPGEAQGGVILLSHLGVGGTLGGATRVAFLQGLGGFRGEVTRLVSLLSQGGGVRGGVILEMYLLDTGAQGLTRVQPCGNIPGAVLGVEVRV